MVKMIDNYILSELIGQGNYGKVYRARHQKKTGEFAVKIIPVEKFRQIEKLEQCTINEVTTLETIGTCENIVRYYERLKSKNNCYYVYEYCNGGTLMDALRKQGRFTEKQTLVILRELQQAFKVLNRFNIMHRDLKPENIFFHNGHVKLGDFGFCKGLKPDQNMARTMLGSPIYMAPEVLRGQAYTTKADIWSLGVILYEMLFGRCPFESKSIGMLINTINTTDVSIPNHQYVSEKTQTLLKKMLAKDYFRRISWVELFCYKIDENGQYTEPLKNNEQGHRPSFNLNKSASNLKDYSNQKVVRAEPYIAKHAPINNISAETLEDIGQVSIKKIQIERKPASVPKNDENDIKNKFYSQKYMNAFLLPIMDDKEEKKPKGPEIEVETSKYLNSIRLILSNEESQRTRNDQESNDRNKNGRDKGKDYSPVKKQAEKDVKQEKLKVIESPLKPGGYSTMEIVAKRQELLQKHEECLGAVKQALQKLQNREVNCLTDSYVVLCEVHTKLKKITEWITSSEMELMDISSLVNYEIIQIDRQLIETRQQLMRRKIEIPHRKVGGIHDEHRAFSLSAVK